MKSGNMPLLLRFSCLLMVSMSGNLGSTDNPYLTAVNSFTQPLVYISVSMKRSIIFLNIFSHCSLEASRFVKADCTTEYCLEKNWEYF